MYEKGFTTVATPFIVLFVNLFAQLYPGRGCLLVPGGICIFSAENLYLLYALCMRSTRLASDYKVN